MSKLEQLSQKILVTPVAQYIASQSAPEQDRYVYAYHISIQNNSDQTIQLLSRKWLITDGDGNTSTVEGEGVVGQQPTLKPAQEYQYQSGSILKTPIGTMEGAYIFDVDGEKLEVPIPVFRLSVPNVIN